MIHQNVQKLINDYQTILDRDPLDQMEDTQSILVRFAQQLATEMGEIVVASPYITMINKQIEDLMYKSGLTAQGCWDEMDDYDKQAIEKFAELIVKECVTIMTDASDSKLRLGDAIWNTKIHFGIE